MIFARRETKPNLGLFTMGATIGSCWQECEGISNNATILISESFAISLPNKTIYIYMVRVYWYLGWSQLLVGTNQGEVDAIVCV